MKIFKTKDQRGLHSVYSSADDEYFIGVSEENRLVMMNSRNRQVFSLAMVDEPISMETIVKTVHAVIRSGGVKGASKIGMWNVPVQESIEATKRLLELFNEYVASPEQKLFSMVKKNPVLRDLYRKMNLEITNK